MIQTSAAKKMVPDSDAAAEAEIVPIKKIGVIGAGQMGSGIAHVAALAGLDVTMVDVAQDRVDAGRNVIEKNLERQVARGRVTDADRKTALAKIKGGTDYSLFGDCDLVIEAATENEGVKRKVFEQLLPFLRKDAMIATNTSSISITRLAAATDRPGRFIGMHFMNPVPAMQLVEIIPELLRVAVPRLARQVDRPCACRDALSLAIWSDKSRVAAELVERLRPILGRYF